MRSKRPLREPVREKPGPKVKNYITPAGLERLKAEHRFLMNRERPAVTEVVAWAAGNGDRSENADYLYGKRRLRQIDSRIRFLTRRIDAAEVADPAARVTSTSSTASPGDRVVLRAPRKTESLEILDVEYAPIPMDPFREPPGAEAVARG
jgi:transcription elongation factor GreB